MILNAALSLVENEASKKPRPKNLRWESKGRLAPIVHRLPTKKGKPDGKRSVKHSRAELVDHSRYPGSVLREIRSRRLNFHG